MPDEGGRTSVVGRGELEGGTEGSTFEKSEVTTGQEKEAGRRRNAETETHARVVTSGHLIG